METRSRRRLRLNPPLARLETPDHRAAPPLMESRNRRSRRAKAPLVRNTIVVEKIDRISGLPKTILHDILSRLPEKDVVRTSILSKAWRETWYTFPVLSISDKQIINWTFRQSEEEFFRKRKIFLDYVKKTLLRFSDQGLAIKEFKLRVDCFNLRCMSQDMDLWMKLITECSVGVLDLIVHNHGPKQNNDNQDLGYILKPGVLEAKSLNKLFLLGEIRVDQAFLNHSIKFFSLRELSLTFVLLGDEGDIKHLLSHCPLIEHITLKRCSIYNPLSTGRISRMKSISMHGLQKLKSVEVDTVQEVYIDAPNLENVYYSPVLDLPFKLNFDNCRNLRLLYIWQLRSPVIENQWFLELFSKFPLLESLKFGVCYVSEKINISSDQLKFLEFYLCFNFKEVNIDAPNLLSCGYSGFSDEIPVISFLRSSPELEVDLQIHISILHSCKLTEIIQSFKPHKVLISLNIDGPVPNVNVLQVSSSPPPSIKHLHLYAIQKRKPLYLPLVNWLLSSCCPETISFSWPSEYKAFIKFFYDTLLGKNQSDCYCSSGHTESSRKKKRKKDHSKCCWWHGLKGDKVTRSVRTVERDDFKFKVTGDPTFAQNEVVSFKLEL